VRWDDRRSGKQATEVLGHEIAHADRAHLAVGEQILERAIGIEREVESTRQRLMQQQIDAVDTELRALLSKACSAAS
jgi:hypothetical protein